MIRKTAVVLCAFLAVSLFAGDPNDEYSRALMLKNEKDYQGALEVLKKIQGHPEEFRVKYNIAECYYLLKDADNAEKYSKDAIALKENYYDPYVLLFNVYNNEKKYPEAADVLADLSQYYPEKYELYYTLGYINGNNLGNFPLSEYYFKKLVDGELSTTVPNYYKDQTYVFLSTINYEGKNYPEAVKYLKKAVELNRENNPKLYKIATDLLGVNAVGSAAEALEFYIDNLGDEELKNPFLLKVYSYLGNINYTFDSPRAVYFLRKALPDTTHEGRIARALFQERIGAHDEAKSELEKIVIDYPNYIAPHIALARINAKKGDSENAYN